MDKTKARTNGRDIYEATEKDYNTSDYRRKLCNKWLCYQQAQPTDLYEPTVLESIAPDHADKSKMRKSQKKQANGKISIDNAKTSKLQMDAEFDGFWDFEMNKVDYNERAKSVNDDWFFSAPSTNRKKEKSAKNEARKSHEILNGHSKHTHQSRSMNAQHRSTKRSRAPDRKADFNDVDYDKGAKFDLSFDFNTNDFQCNKLDEKLDAKLDNGFDDFDQLTDCNDLGKENRIVTSTVNRKRHSEQHIPYLPKLPKNMQSERRKSNKEAELFATPKLVTYKIEETNYLETPIWEKHWDDAWDSYNLMEKGTQQQTVPFGKSDRQFAAELNDWNKHGHRKMNDTDLQQYLEKPIAHAKKGLNLLGGTILNHSSGGNTQPINIYCINKLVVRTD